MRGSSLFVLLFFFVSIAHAEVERHLSQQGMSGLLNTPNALVVESGQADISYSNQTKKAWRGTVPRQDNYHLNLGLLPYLEFGGRLTEAPGQVRDLSASAKLQLPMPARWPQFAVGIQDVSGGSSHFRTYYLVGSYELYSRLRLSLGYGLGPDRLDGAFGGLELQLNDWLQLVAEHDGEEPAAGLRLKTPRALLPRGLQIALSLAAPVEERKEWSTAVTLSLPLGYDPGASCKLFNTQPQQTSQSPSSTDMRKSFPPDNISPSRYLALQEILIKEGYEEVRIGLREGHSLLIELENSRFNHNELDALGQVLGIAHAMFPEGVDSVILRLLNSGLSVLELETGTDLLNALYDNSCQNPPERPLPLAREMKVTVSPVADVRRETWLTPIGNRRLFHTSLELSPGLATGVGTDYGVFDYRLSAMADSFIQLWRGASARILASVPVAWSDDYREGAPLNPGDNQPRIERILLNQTLHPANGVLSLFSGGQFREHLDGIINETVWTSPRGQHQFRLKSGLLKPDEDSLRTPLLGTYRYAIPALDAQLTLTAGKFFAGDKGFILEGKRWFGDTAIGLFYINTDYEIGGIRFSIPLTPRRDMAYRPIQIKGTAEWNYQLHTVIADDGENNPLVNSSAIFPQTEYTVERDFLNRDRLEAHTIRKAIPRMRQAYEQYPAPE